jgi:hypothetical protein
MTFLNYLKIEKKLSNKQIEQLLIDHETRDQLFEDWSKFMKERGELCVSFLVV